MAAAPCGYGHQATFLPLGAKPNCGGPYAIIAGKTSLISPASAEKDKVRKNLLERLNALDLPSMATAPLLCGEANDLTVSVANICRQPHCRPRKTVREVPCDHLTYSGMEAGLRTLDELLPK
jgi:hypothetical protein